MHSSIFYINIKKLIIIYININYIKILFYLKLLKIQLERSKLPEVSRILRAMSLKVVEKGSMCDCLRGFEEWQVYLRGIVLSKFHFSRLMYYERGFIGRHLGVS